MVTRPGGASHTRRTALTAMAIVAISPLVPFNLISISGFPVISQDGVSVFRFVQGGYEGKGHKFALIRIPAGHLFEAPHLPGLYLTIIGLDREG